MSTNDDVTVAKRPSLVPTSDMTPEEVEQIKVRESGPAAIFGKEPKPNENITT